MVAAFFSHGTIYVIGVYPLGIRKGTLRFFNFS